MNTYLTPDEVCKKLQIPMSTLYLLTRKKRIPHAKVGRRLRFEESTIDKWFKDKVVTASCN